MYVLSNFHMSSVMIYVTTLIWHAELEIKGYLQNVIYDVQNSSSFVSSITQVQNVENDSNVLNNNEKHNEHQVKHSHIVLLPHSKTNAKW